MIYFLVGPMGVGKNYVGKQLASNLDCEFVDGDDFVPQAMAKKVSRFKRLSMRDLNNFVLEHLIPAIETLHSEHENIVVAQALYRKGHRALIKDKFGDDCVFIHIKVPLLTNIKRLLSREKGLRWALYGLINRPFFQSDGLKYSADNDTDKVFTLKRSTNEIFEPGK